MKITVKNYFREIKKIKISSLPEEMQQAHSVFNDATDKGKDWDIYNDEKDIKEMIDIYLKKLNSFLLKPENKSKIIKLKLKAVKVIKPKSKTKKPTQTPTVTRPKPSRVMNTKTKKVASVNKEIALIKRFVNMLGKEKTKSQILGLMNAVQKYLFERRARRVYKYSEELLVINTSLMAAFQKQATNVKVGISAANEKHLRDIAGLEKERISVVFIKEYINVQGKAVTKAKVKRLYNRIADAINNGNITKRDRHWKHIERILDSLKNYYQKEILTINKAELSGLQGIVSDGNSQKKKQKVKV